MRNSRISELLILLSVVILLSHSVLADFVVRDNQTINRGDRDGYKNASFYCWNDGTCQTTAASGSGSSYNDTNLSLRVTNLETNASSTNARLAQINTSANILTHAYAAGINKTSELLIYFSALFLGVNDQRYNETGRVDALNTSKLDTSDQRFNETTRLNDINTSLQTKINSSQDQNNYTLECSVTGTTTKTATCSRNGATNVSFSWTDIDTDTDTNNGGTSNVTNVISGNLYIIAVGNSTHFNLTLNITAVNGSWNDTPLIQALNTSLLSLISAKVGNGTDINASRLRVNGVDVCLSNGTNCPSSAADQNNYTTSIDVTGTTTKTINLVRNGAPNINATFTDIDTDTQGNTTFGNGTATYRVDSGKTVRILPGRNVSDIQIANDTSGNLNLTIHAIDTDTFNTSAQMISATNNTLDARRVACGNITGASSNLCTLTDTDTNNGGTSNWSFAQSPNGSIVFTTNSTHVNGTVNGTWLDTQVVTQNEYPNLDTDATNDVNTSSLMRNGTGSRINVTGNSTNLILTIAADNLTGADIQESSLGAVPTATALAADPANCAAGSSAAGVSEGGVAEGCQDTLNTSDSLSNTTGSRLTVTGSYNALVLTIASNNLTGTDIDETTLSGTAASLTAGDLSCSDCIGTPEIADSYVLAAGDTRAADFYFRNINATGDVNASILREAGLRVCRSDGTNCPAATVPYQSSAAGWTNTTTTTTTLLMTGIGGAPTVGFPLEVYGLLDDSATMYLSGGAAKFQMSNGTAYGGFQFTGVKGDATRPASNGNPLMDYAYNAWIGGTEKQLAIFRVTLSDNTSGSEDTQYEFYSYLNGALATPLTVAGGLITSTVNVVLNNNLTVATNTFFVDGANDKVGVGTTSLSQALTVNGGVNASGDVLVHGGYETMSVDKEWCGMMACIGTSCAQSCTPFVVTTVASGTAAQAQGNTTWPGIIAVSDATGANSGMRVHEDLTARVLNGSEHVCANIAIAANTQQNNSIHLIGFHDSTNGAEPTEGCWAEIINITLGGRTRAAARNSTTTNVSLQTRSNKFYKICADISSDGQRCTITAYNNTDNKVNTTAFYNQTISNNIPLSTDRVVGANLGSFTTTAGTATVIAWWDFLNVETPASPMAKD